MSDLLVAAVALVAVVSNVYWWRRTRATERGLRRSLDRDRRVAERADDGDDETATATATATLRRAARRADCPPADLPERVETLRATVADLETETDHLRDRWAQSWWEALGRDPPDVETPHVLVVDLPDAGTDDVQAFADHARTRPAEVALVVGRSTGTFAVSVGDDLRNEVSAADIAADVSERAGGGSGGDTVFATGGGADPDALEAAVAAVAETVRDSL
ncbi:MAG: DHH family phosphoesterase [Haloplanus sp.]